MSFAPVSSPSRHLRRRAHHGILPIKALPARHDWGEQALQRTWRSVSFMCLTLAVLNAFLARLPAGLFMLAAVWALFKGNPALSQRLANHPVWGASLRWWLHRGRPLPSQAPDTTPQM